MVHDPTHEGTVPHEHQRGCHCQYGERRDPPVKKFEKKAQAAEKYESGHVCEPLHEEHGGRSGVGNAEPFLDDVGLYELTDLAGDPDATQSTRKPGLVIAKTPWIEIDDVFYEARGYVWALSHILRAIEVDFDNVLQKKNAQASLSQVIRLLEQALVTPSSPMVLNGDPLGWVANYSKSMVSYISPANAAIIDLRNLLAKG